MKLRFRIDQSEALRQGYDAPTSTVTVTVKPSNLSQEERDLLADRMYGIDVYELTLDNPPFHSPPRPPTKQRSSQLIMTTKPTYAALIEAVRENEKEVEAELRRLKDGYRKATES